MNRRPLTSEAAWEGVWVRNIGGPNTSGRTVHMHPWHRIVRVDEDRLWPNHGRGEPQWPFMGTRLEICRPYGGVPPEGRICSLCVRIQYPLQDTRPVQRQEYVDPDEAEDMVEAIAKRVIERLEKRA